MQIFHRYPTPVNPLDFKGVAVTCWSIVVTIVQSLHPVSGKTADTEGWHCSDFPSSARDNFLISLIRTS
jgi:hypothetical protein